MSTSETNKPDPTKGNYWGGPILSYDTYWWLAVLPTGFFGIDHLALRSPSTAWKKFLVNILFLGAWYFYDIFQVVGDKKNIARYGLSSPLGAFGIGYNLFTDADPTKVEKPSPNVSYGNTMFYILYAIFLLVPFGISNILAGDLYGGLLRLFSCVFVFTIPLYLIYGVMEAWNACDSPSDIFDKGITRPFPLNWVLGTEFYPPTNVVSASKAQPLVDKYNQEMADQTLVGRVSGLVSGLAMKLLSYVGGPLYGTVKTTAKAACAGADAAEKAGEAAVELSKAGPNLKAAMDSPVPSTPNMNVSTLKPSALNINTNVGDPVSIPTAPPIIMKGGAELPSLGDGMILSGILFLIVGGLGLTLLRKMMNNRKRDGKDPLDDQPPEARTF